jgi:hypothetical protein
LGGLDTEFSEMRKLFQPRMRSWATAEKYEVKNLVPDLVLASDTMGGAQASNVSETTSFSSRAI